MKHLHWLISLSLVLIPFGPAFSAKVCRKAVATTTLSFQSDTKLTVLAQPQALQWLSRKHLETVITEALQDGPFLKLLTENLEIERIEFSGLQFSTVQISDSAIQLKVQVVLDKWTFEYLLEATLEADHSVELQVQELQSKPKLKAQHRIFVPVFLQILNAKLAEGVSLGLEKISPLKPTELVAGQAGLQVGLGTPSLVHQKKHQCQITCAPFDVAVVANRGSLQEVLQKVWYQPEMQKPLAKVTKDFTFVGVPQILGIKPLSADEFSVHMQMQLKPQSHHSLRMMVTKDFVVQINLTLAFKMDAEKQTLTPRLLELTPEGVRFDEKNLIGPLGFFASLTPQLIKQGLHEQIVSLLRQEVRLQMTPLNLPNLKIPGLPEFPALQVVGLGVASEAGHPYLALRFLAAP